MRNSSFRRKIVYLCLIAVLLIPISYLSMPDRRNQDGQISGGGVLAQVRRNNGLAEAALGEIDPAGESIRLAAVGMKGIAANILWLRANEYKKKEKWDKLSATCNQITKLQPHFIKVWDFQAWNLSYNVSVEFDDYRQRYLWVTKGIDFIIGGTKYNRDESRLLAQIGWYTGHKIGKADEKKEFRRLFRDDEDFHRRMPEYISMRDTAGPDGKPDNWLLSNQWHSAAESAAERRTLRGQSPLVFYSKAPMALVSHAVAIEEEGYLNEYAQQAWARSGDAWQKYSNREIPTSAGFGIRLGDLERRKKEVADLKTELETLCGITQAEIIQEKTQKLAEDQRLALEKPLNERSEAEHQLAAKASADTETTYDEVIQRGHPSQIGRVNVIAARLQDAEQYAQFTERYRGIVNHDYWRTRCEVEQKAEAILARSLVYDADRARRKLELERARELYDKAWLAWAVIFKDYPKLAQESEGEDIVEAIKRYKKLLADLDDPDGFPPKDFPLLDLVKMHNLKYRLLDTDYHGTSPSTSANPQTVTPAE